TFQAAPGAPGPARFRPYASTVHHVTKGRYITSNDARGYIPVYEYPLNNQWIMMDIDDGYILWTGIWKADIVKMIDSQPDLAHVIRRVRGGYLKIQGTWMPYDVRIRLSRDEVAWNIREDLVPLFGPTFPSTCLSPDQPGYGQVVASAGRRRARRSHIQPLVPAQETHSNASIFQQARHPSFGHGALPPLSDPPRERHRYAPYPISPVSDIQQHMMPPPRRSSASSLLDLPGLRAALPPPSPRMPSPPRLPIHLPAIQTHLSRGASSDSVYALPPISALEDLRGVDTHDAAAVLRRLNSDDDDDDVHRRPARRALSVPAPR
ncbi:transcription regulator HTH, apses-type DNA-binding domain-containing protein, partial [Roridomyces roridus]